MRSVSGLDDVTFSWPPDFHSIKQVLQNSVYRIRRQPRKTQSTHHGAEQYRLLVVIVQVSISVLHSNRLAETTSGNV